jgi:hypothetical protein
MYWLKLNGVLRATGAAACLIFLFATCPAAVDTTAAAGLEGVEIEVLASDGAVILLEMRLGSFGRIPVEIAGETYYGIALPGEPFTAPAGEPALPRVSRSIIIPADARMEVEILDSEFVDLAMPVGPSRGPLVRGVLQANERRVFSPTYDTRGFHPESPVSLGRAYILRDFRGIAVSVSPFAYDPSTQTLRAYTRLVIRVFPAGAGVHNVRTCTGAGARVGGPAAGSYSSSFRQIYDAHFLNFSAERYTPVVEEGRLVVIAHADYLDAIEPYVEWKNQKGIVTDLYDVAAIGSTPEDIRDFVAAQYYSADGLAFVQLVGDAHQVPTFLTDVIFWDIHGCSDSSYGLIEGVDTYPEVLVGRFSAQSVEQLETQVERTVWYERDIAGGHWLHRAAGLGTVWGEGHGYNGWSGVQSLEVIRLDLLGYHYTEVAELYEEGVPPFGIIPVEAWEVTEVLEDGIGLLNVDGNADTTYLDTGSYTIGHIHALENDYALPFIFLAAPWCGNFVKNCFAEEWLRATNEGDPGSNGAPTGAIAVYCWSNALEYAPPQAAMHEMVDLLVGEEMHTFGGLVMNGACFMMDLYGAPDEYDTFRNANILGDASLTVRTTYPEEMLVDHEAGILIGQTEFDVATGVPGSLVCLSEAGSIVAVGYADAGGDITLSFDPFAAPTSLTLTVTAFNRVTAVHTVPVFEGTGVPGGGTLETALRAVRPNPAPGGCRIEYSLGRECDVSIEIFSVAGRRVRTLASGCEAPGNRSLLWDGRDDAGVDVSSGVYFLRMAAGDYLDAQRIVMLR